MQTGSVLDCQVTVPLLGLGSHLFAPVASELRQERLTPPENLGKDLDIRFSVSAFADILERIRSKRFARLEWARVAWHSEALGLVNGDELLCRTHLADQWRRVGMIPYPHQLEVARRVVHELGGRAILADEVGLGKTIEAGLILKEYMLRGQVKRALILCPASLMWQWYHELKEKFLISAGIQRTEYDWERAPVLIASLDTAKRQPHAGIIHSLEYDLLIVDEAHKVKNDRTSNHRFVRGIKKTFCLMLTATPVQNDLLELYHLVDLVAPGLLGSRAAFRRHHMLDKRNPADPDALRQRLSRVIIRNRRGPDTVELTPRKVQSISVDFTPGERALYDELTAWALRKDPLTLNPSILSLLTLQREACSSSYACAATLQLMLAKTESSQRRQELERLLQKAAAVTEHAKVNAALKLIEDIQDQVIIFTEYRATQDLLLERLQERGITALGFDGSLSAGRKEWIKELFRRYGQVLVSTESGGEGLNFQFCCHVINYDLPWNPMKVEQRIGRVHRLGQTRDVHIYNLATRDTIEEYILHLLYEKIRLFELAVGELDEILSHSFQGADLEKALIEALSRVQSPEDIRKALADFAANLARPANRSGIHIDTFL